MVQIETPNIFINCALKVKEIECCNKYKVRDQYIFCQYYLYMLERVRDVIVGQD